MEHRTDEIGIRLDPDDVDEAIRFSALVTQNWMLTSGLVCEGSIRFDMPEPEVDGFTQLDTEATRKLWKFVFMAAGVHLQIYKDISDQHEYICSSSDLSQKSTVGYLEDLEIELFKESRLRGMAITFVEEIDRNLALSRAAVQLAIDTKNSKLNPSDITSVQEKS